MSGFWTKQVEDPFHSRVPYPYTSPSLPVCHSAFFILCFPFPLLLFLAPRDHAVLACSSSTTSQLVVLGNSRRSVLGHQPSAVLVRLEYSLDRRVCL
eukprot:14847753-Heterocapsa_arctica.AAC.1